MPRRGSFRRRRITYARPRSRQLAISRRAGGTRFGGRGTRRSFNNYLRPVGNQGNTRAAPVPAGFLPKTKLCNLKYATEFNIDPTMEGIGVFKIRANDCFDPEDVFGGHSAYMFDDIMRFYKKWRVISSKIRVWYIQPLLTTVVPAYVTILTSANGLMNQSFANAAHILESNVRGNVRSVGSVPAVNQSQAGQKATNTKTYSQSKFYPGIKDKDFEGTYNGGPAQHCFWEIIMFQLAGNAPAKGYFRAEISFNVLFSECILLSQAGVDGSGLGIGGGPVSNNTGSTGVAGPTGAQYASGDGGEDSNTGPDGGIV